jgi:two-component system, NarL family, response regulator LiaR
MSAETIRLCIVDRHTLWRQSLVASLETNPDLQVVAEASSGGEAIDLCKQRRPHALLTDVILPDMHGEQLARIMRRLRPNIKIIALANLASKGLIQMMLRAGATSYVLKNISPDDLAVAIRNAYHGKSTLAPEAAEALVLSIHQPDLSYLRLTGREREILNLMTRGLTNAEIADHLTISILTVKKHVSSILGKLNTSNRTEAIAMTLEQQLLADWQFQS